MAHSLELRSPLLDHEVLALGLALPDELKLKGREGKQALRRAFADLLPPEVAGRGKAGFGVPLASWFRGDLRDLAGDVLLADDGLFRREAVERLLAEHAEGAPTTGTGSGASSCWSCGSGRISTTRYRPEASPRLWLIPLAVVGPRLIALLHERGAITAAFTDKSDDFALTFVRHGTFGFIPGQPSAYTQPLYGFFLIPIYWILGRHWLWIGLAQIAVALGVAWLVYLIGKRIADERVALVAALLTTLHPYLVWHDVHMNREILDQLLAAALVLLALARRPAADAVAGRGARRGARGSRCSGTRA